ncbi:MAG: DUF3575 domain-containing protein [Sphingobacteriaceae bacterium]|nr:DUF3575 domain-containing protein [Sphingobacteriaceae bacterium]
MKLKLVYFSFIFSISCQILVGKNKDGRHFKKIVDKNNSTSVLFGESDDKKGRSTSRNVVKLNLTSTILTNPTIQYEFAFHNNMSAAVAFSYFTPKKIPNFYYRQKSNEQGWKNARFDGWSVTGEYRFYPGQKTERQAPNGFYFAPYYRYASYTLKADYVQTNGGVTRDFGMKGTYSGYTIGGMIGAQFLPSKNFSIDIWILGMGFGKSKLKLEGWAKDGQPILQDALTNDILEHLDDLGKFGKGNVELDVSTSAATLEITKLPMSSYRIIGICLGFAF